MNGLLIASPMSGSGKTTVTLGLLRALSRAGHAVASGKAGPDYIDPAFHAAACGQTCMNFDPWAMRRDLLLANAGLVSGGDRLLVIEAMMGLFDAAADGTGAAGDLAALLRLPVVFVVNCAKLSHSVAALVQGFARFDPNVMIAGVILNNVASERHEVMLRDALDVIGMDVFGAVRRKEALQLPERHLGLVQAGEHEALEAFIEAAADTVESGCDLETIMSAANTFGSVETMSNVDRLPPPGQRIAVARDEAFAFSYEHMLLGWRRRGAEISFFSPLAAEAPADDCDAVYLPGGYPELHAARLSAASRFRAGIVAAADRDIPIYGECGGYMVLGESLIDGEGEGHAMLGLLPLTTSFAERRLHLGYRRAVPCDGFFCSKPMTAHEFHYATVKAEGEAEGLFDVEDARGTSLGSVGLRRGSVCGSFMHLIDLADTE
ncbi:cobyrinate a,c-diamide synthase [Hoeflea prorocentri]|uniref:Hydrogenobyrinate a,c-diamide synthase n=1 Tax=Hoeflea prorocentri TaxID=1922333 RepID=A0A9X3ZHI5_9HYPH|nr:cobyrinate a,c-diamide synthase [Hoeflea prorocentri]MCY6381374.1 cobyrinate a,c-diamide synthase [Hoeflea prorocentri]MDA5399174.1 cobyrinate a,c-diamide synthase [Hoeflea prorocentri]